MRTTLDIDDDVLFAAKERARRERRSAGAVISELARKALTGTNVSTAEEDFFGFRTLPPTGRVITKEFIDELIEESGE